RYLNGDVRCRAWSERWPRAGDHSGALAARPAVGQPTRSRPRSAQKARAGRQRFRHDDAIGAAGPGIENGEGVGHRGTNPRRIGAPSKVNRQIRLRTDLGDAIAVIVQSVALLLSSRMDGAI